LVISLAEKCLEFHRVEAGKQGEFEEAMKQLTEVLKFYFGKEVEEWVS
jgi:hypothetical protein